MKIACSPAGIIDTSRPAQGVIDIAGAQFQGIVLDMSLFLQPGELEYFGEKTLRDSIGKRILENPESMSECLKPFLEVCKENGLSFDLAYAPHLLRDTKRVCRNGQIKTLAEKLIRVCADCGCGYVVVRPLSTGIAGEDIWKANRDFYLELAGTARQYGVMILLENQSRSVGGHQIRGICSDGVLAAQWVDELNALAAAQGSGAETFGFCLNVGTCSRCGQDMYEFAHALGARIRAVILSDGEECSESALLPFSGARMGSSGTDWLKLIRGLRKISFDGVLVMNLRDTAAAFSPILRPNLMQLAKAVADYLKWQIEIEHLLKKYDSRVLFGAGNMCRSYMKCYGSLYPPLFTCDNNEARWGEEFCGLVIHSPQKLLELPQDTAIFICNVYYREIEAQLRRMEIKNPIEFFNDEYMPSFYLNRVEDL